MGEIKRTDYKDSIKVISLGSRQTHCVNKQVQQLKSINRINDKCMDLQAKKEKETLSSCPHYKSTTNQNKFTDHALVSIFHYYFTTSNFFIIYFLIKKVK